ncbi:MAG TPA: hypothetical protein HPP76_06110 [Desulfuromonadales bacterium]|nr:hypothetical protein [Desulfuromonadales bacterium]
MSLTRIISILFCVCAIWSLTGCAYRLSGSSQQNMTAGRTLWVPFIGNESISPTAQTVLRRALYDEFHALRGLVPAENEAAADVTVKGKLVSYGSRAVSYNAADRVRAFSLQAAAELAIYRKGETTPFWKGALSGSKEFPANSDLALQRNAEEQAFEGAARIIARKLASTMEHSY